MRITGTDLDRRFDYHPPPDEVVVMRHQEVRSACLNAAHEIIEATGEEPSREQSMAITKLEEAMFWANAAIARNFSAPRNESLLDVED